MKVARHKFEKLWHEVLRKYYKEELKLEYNDLQEPPHSLNQVLDNEDKGEEWPDSTPDYIKQKRKLRYYVRDQALIKSSALGEKNLGKGPYLFSGSTYRNRYDELKDNKEITTTSIFLKALSRTLDFESFDQFCKVYNLSDEEINVLKKGNIKLRRTRLIPILVSILFGIILSTLVSWILNSKAIIPKAITPKGYIYRSVADTSTVAKGVIGNWYSYNRTYEARGKTDGFIFNRIAWQIISDKDGYLALKRHWKAMEFDGWIEFIEGTSSQLHIFLNVYQSGNGYKTPIGYRHFNCGLWGENTDWLHVDTLSCLCTTYTFSDSKLGEPLASREILIRQHGISFDSLKRGAISLKIKDAPWLERFLPKNDSYIFQKPR